MLSLATFLRRDPITNNTRHADGLMAYTPLRSVKATGALSVSQKWNVDTTNEIRGRRENS